METTQGLAAEPARSGVLAQRLLVGALALTSAGLGVMLWRATREEGSVAVTATPTAAQLVVFDLAGRVAELARLRPDASDMSETYFASPTATVHVHVIGLEQRCPLHIHRKTHEATVIVSGAPEVLQIWPVGGELTRREQRHAPGALLYSPPFCGHKWVNESNTEVQANLVFASPPFDGNFYVDADDARMLRGGEPAFVDPDRELERLASEGQPFLLTRLPVMEGKMSSLVLRDRAPIEEDTGPTVLYVTRGRGTLHSGGSQRLRERQLVVVPPATPLELEADPEAPLAVLVFRPGVSRPQEAASGA